MCNASACLNHLLLLLVCSGEVGREGSYHHGREAGKSKGIKLFIFLSFLSQSLPLHDRINMTVIFNIEGASLRFAVY